MPDQEPRPSSRANIGDLAAKARARSRVGMVISGRYKIVDLLAMGGVGAVYLGEHLRMHKHVAIKVLHPDSQGLPDLVARFEREAVAGAHIQHPNVACATDFGELEDGALFLVLEYVRGTTLREVIGRGPLPAARAAGIARQIAAALSATHAMGIVHRDVTPRNVMLIEGERDVVKLIDFGLAKLKLHEVSDVAAGRASLADHRITGTGAVFGTIAYLAPEAVVGMDTVDARADLYALGVVLYEMLAGRHPFDTSNPIELFKRHAKETPMPIAQRSPEVAVSPLLEAVTMRLLAKPPEDRYQTAEAVLAALDAALGDGAQSPPPPPISSGGVYPGPSITITPPPPSIAVVTAKPDPPAALPPSRRVRWPYAAAGLAGLSFAAVAVWSRESLPPPATSGPATVASSAVAPPPATAAAVPTAAPSASASASAAPFDPAAARATFRRAAAARDRAQALAAFLDLAEHDAAVFHDPAMVVVVRDFASVVAISGAADADRLFDVLGHRLGTDGLDILYDVVRVRGGSRAAQRAEALLREAGAMERASPTLRITWTVREAPCADKAALLDRAVVEGDARTLMLLETNVTACMGPGNEALKGAIKSLRQRAR